MRGREIPLLVERGGFYESLEVTDLVSLLQVLDNPLQDLPLLAVLRAPLAGLSLDELARLRLASPKERLWTALERWVAAQGTGEESESVEKLRNFLERLGRWRRLARQASLSGCLEAILTETHYGEWLLTQPRGEQRQANLQRLARLAQQFDQFQRQGLFRFLRFIEAQQEAETEPEVGAASEEDSVRLMSIHQSKGLEFPVVVVADLGKSFNVSDLRAEVILDEVYGLCPQVKPPQTGQRYPSLPYWLARRRQYREMLGEELRLLYVAMTRARERLVLSGTISASKFAKLWRGEAGSGAAALSAARSYADWIGGWFAEQEGSAEGVEGQAGGVLRWRVYEDAELGVALPESEAGDGREEGELRVQGGGMGGSGEETGVAVSFDGRDVAAGEDLGYGVPADGDAG